METVAAHGVTGRFTRHAYRFEPKDLPRGTQPARRRIADIGARSVVSAAVRRALLEKGAHDFARGPTREQCAELFDLDFDPIAKRLFRAFEQGLRRPQRSARFGDELLRNRVRARLDFRAWTNLMDETEATSLFGIEGVTEHQQARGVMVTGKTPEQERRTRLGTET